MGQTEGSEWEVVVLAPPRSTGCGLYDCSACTGFNCPHKPEHPFAEAWRHHRATGEPLPPWMKKLPKKKGEAAEK